MTHQRHHLPRCDRILVLRGGCIVADGSFQQLQVCCTSPSRSACDAQSIRRSVLPCRRQVPWRHLPGLMLALVKSQITCIRGVCNDWESAVYCQLQLKANLRPGHGT